MKINLICQIFGEFPRKIHLLIDFFALVFIKTVMSNFRCPFEAKGESQGTHLEVDLSDCDVSLESSVNKSFVPLLQEAVHGFVDSPKKTALIAQLPNKLLHGKNANSAISFEQLSYFHAVIVASVIEKAAYPYLSFQSESPNLELSGEEKITRKYVGKFFEKAQNFRDLISAIMLGYLLVQEAGKEDEMIHVNSPDQHILEFGAGAISFPIRKRVFPGSQQDFKYDFFWIVRTPFYPENIGRYAPEPQIVMTRQFDFLQVDPEVRKRIRANSNAALQSAGCNLGPKGTGMLPGGLWDERPNK